jgi:hypothetical protein
MNLANDLRLGEHEEVVVSLEILTGPIGESVAAVIGLLQFVLLDHRAHRAVEEDYTLREQIAKGFFGSGDHFDESRKITDSVISQMKISRFCVGCAVKNPHRSAQEPLFQI